MKGIEDYFNLMANVQRRRGGNKTHQEIQEIIRKNKLNTLPVPKEEMREIKKEGKQLKLF